MYHDNNNKIVNNFVILLMYTDILKRVFAISVINGFLLIVFELFWGLHFMAPKRHRPFPPPPAAAAMFSSESSFMIPIFFPKFLTPSITFCCIKLKHMAMTAMPMRI